MKSLSITVLLGLCSTLPWPPLATASAITRSSEIHSNRAQWEVEFGATGATVTRYLRASVHHEPRRLVEPIVEGFELGMDLEAYAKDINSPPLKECILLFGAFCNGNLGDVIQSGVMEDLLTAVSPDQCIWYGHSYKEHGEFFGLDPSRVIPLSSDSAEDVNKFKAMIIGGGGIFVAQHLPLCVNQFAEALTVPVVIMGVGASSMAKHNTALIERAIFVSGRDKVSVIAFQNVLRASNNPVVTPEQVQMVRDPVISDKMQSDTSGRCWRQSESSLSPVCFVLPAADSATLNAFHDNLVNNIVREGDVFVNIFPKHQAEIEAHGYPGKIRTILDPKVFRSLCQCRAIISSRLHGAVLGLHMGVPTLGAWHAAEKNKIPNLIKEVMKLPDQFVHVDETLTRSDLDVQLDAVTTAYSNGDRRTLIHALLATYFSDFEAQAKHVMNLIAAEPVHPGTPKPVTKGSATTKEISVTDKEDSKAEKKGETNNEAPEIKYNLNAKSEELAQKGTTKASIGDAEAKPVETKPVGAEAAAAAAAETAAPEASHHNASGTGGKSTKEMTPEGKTTARQAPKPALGDTLEDQLPLSSHTPQSLPRVGNNGIEDILYMIVGDYMATTVLVVCIVALSLRRQRKSSTPHSFPSSSSNKGMTDTAAVDAGEAVSHRGVFDDVDQCTQQPFSTPAVTPPSRNFFSVPPKKATSPTYRTAVTSNPRRFLAVNFVVWVSLAVGFSAYGKAYLHDTQDPAGLLTLQGLVGVVVLGTLGRCGTLDLSPVHEICSIVRGHSGWAATLHTSQALLTNFSVLVGGVAVTNALKALEPVAAAVFSYLAFGKKIYCTSVIAIITIVVGIIILTSKSRDKGRSGVGEEGSVGGGGDQGSAILRSAFVTVAAVCCNALRNVVLKKGASVPPHVTLFVCSATAALVGTGLLVFRFLLQHIDASSGSSGSSCWIRLSGINAALCFVGYNFASFNILTVLSPVGHAVGNSCKRMVVFASGLLLLGEGMSARQLSGAALALVGVMGYNIAGL